MAKFFLGAFSLVVDALPVRQEGSRSHQLGCRFLLALFVMDALSWAAYRIIQFEAIRNAQYADSFKTFGISTVIFVSTVVWHRSTHLSCSMQLLHLIPGMLVQIPPSRR